MIDASHLTPNGPRAPTAQDIANAAARALPDALFANYPETKRLTADYARLRDTRHSLLERRTWLAAQRKQLEAQVQEGQNAIQRAALTDCAASDSGFARTRAAVTELATLSALLDATSGTMRMLEQRPATGNEIDRAVDAARIALERHVLALKQAHVAEQSATASTQ